MSIKKYTSGSWVDIPYKKYETATDTITTLPKQIIADGQSASAVIKGNMSQSGTPTPASPIYPTECGDLVASGEHSGQYQIPISSANTTTPVYFGEVESTRRIQKVVFTGGVDETWNGDSLDNKMRYYPRPMIANGVPLTEAISTHFAFGGFNANSGANGTITGTNSSSAYRMYFWSSDYATVDAWKSFLAQQYANGTPVCVWYVLATPQTAIVNEPLRKIGDYADEVSGITIPTTAGANTISVDTTLQPSEVTVNYKGWHLVADVHEYEDGNDNYIPDLNTLTTTVSNCVIESVSNNTLVLSGNGYTGSSFSQIISNDVMIPSNLIGKTVTLSGSITWSSEGNIAPRVTIMMHRSGSTDYNVSIYQGAFTQTFEVPIDATSYALLFRIDQNRSEYVGTARVTYTNIELKEQPHWN